ncbi:hypothetical protein E1091_10465 [Micromonospora fluostatini]|uniref:Translation initiation factor 2 n=1 Tax=Micromonospora fluostatini TaxID=1629071 RepID=A0ABY2DHA3_9ACTN|nr:hypothetical protein E1091_10465 [Micromonospora fluostatini]
MTTPSGASPEDDYWRRPPATPDGTPGSGPPAGPTAGGSPRPGTGPVGYAGPPPTVAPPPGWRPPLHLQPAPPRHLPPQDMAGLDSAEQRAQRITYGVGAVAGVVLLVLLGLLCSRLVF